MLQQHAGMGSASVWVVAAVLHQLGPAAPV